MSEHKVKKPFKKIIKKRSLQPPPIHPHIEQIQTEISLLQAELDELEVNGKELNQEEEMKKQVTKACLERYQTTLTKLTDSAMKDKLRAYHENYIEREIKYKVENQTLALLQFFYIVRLAQHGLFSAIEVDNASDKLFAVTDFCDQLIGASVYAAKDPSYKSRSFKRRFIFDALKKFEMGSEDIVTKNVTFKQLKTLFDDIWNNTIDEQRALEKVKSNDANWLVIPADEAAPGNVTSPASEDSKKLSVPLSQENEPVNQMEQEYANNEDVFVLKQNGYQDYSTDEILSKKSSKASEKDEYDNNDVQAEIKEELGAHTEMGEFDNIEGKHAKEIKDGTVDAEYSEVKETKGNSTTDVEEIMKEEEEGFQANEDEFAEIREETDSDKKYTESDISADNWRVRNSDNNSFYGRGRGTAPRGFRRGSRGRYMRGRGGRGAPRGRGRGRGYEPHTGAE
ncbi:hypothetical protein G6F37_000863 [Rhizopus arrhizus]|nr:hypothetical protein G6F38_004599 [Rhizopus arrhizus]KAG1163828.1 hypothetical protein G6F37_000863 [Rhizopus arrhizus]